ncbi:MAG: hypothetical protein EYC70_08540 [Planctomycetota bacterium]|nr:MAG: hypothetical protein EYC70_08540 [Planctomycetota bacterium]
MRPIVLGASLLLAAAAPAQVRTPAFFSDHMVLQREAEVPVWGWAAPGTRVRVQGDWMSAPVAAAADAGGAWRLTLRTPGAGGPHRLTIGERTIQDVWIGEVWLCSGQSNMEWTVGVPPWGGNGVDNCEEEVRSANYPQIRVFDVQNTVALAPQDDCAGSWKTCSPDTAGRFSATAYFFGRELHRELKVPIGLITADWGGTVAEAWTGNEGLSDFPEFGPALARIREARARSGNLEDELRAQQAEWWKTLAAKDAGSAAQWQQPKADDSAWESAAQPLPWSQSDLGDFDGVAWYRRSFEVPAAWSGKALVVELPPIDDMDTAWVDGRAVGGLEEDGKWQTPRRYEVPAELAKPGAHVLALRVVDTGGEGGMIGPAETLRVFPQDDPGAALSLAGPWRWRRGASMADIGAYPRSGWFHANTPSALFNGMIAPLVGYGLRGAIWYQGESNRGRAEQYRRLFPALIADWRRLWGIGEFPWYYVQIAPFRYGGDTGQAAELREAQMLALSVPNTGMAVTMDIGDPADIHPRNKQDVGKRLALCALAKTYGKSGVEYSGPVYREMKIEGDRVRLTFGHAGGGLDSKNRPLESFTIAGADRVFHPATAVIDGETVLVSSPQVQQPAAVRYGWAADAMPNLFNQAGLPASSFRTDDWPRE